ncbi:putative metal-binding motif-containing protein [Myxococcus landrumensis]|uniref:Metal-binding motif-containing protein n=1 Tax=Myxococcus landrumensis TaxID=2813577 RepID=A0ABX7MZI6_9BACT|nr:putative metal-binding motif-containing protein [Myxococcus landrumus]QSQ11849.1 putative metal-binding motif-containing protein [Myxococcus landrumus]
MSLWERLAVTGLLVLGGCSVPGLEEIRSERGAFIEVNYSPSFKQGCLVLLAEDATNAANFAVQRLSGMELASQRLPLEWRILRREGWSASAKVTITAHEQSCTGKEVDRSELVVNLSGERRTMTLVTLDEDGDGYVARNGDKGGSDCNDNGPNAAAMYPGNIEVCDDVDNNCDSRTDEGLPTEAFYRDADGDGVGAGQPVQRCGSVAGGWSNRTGDCNDSNREISPGAPEVCDEVDNNCVAGVDEGFDKEWYLDRDGDGAVDGTTRKIQCQQPAGYIRRPPNLDFDCRDDQDFNTPGKNEVCDNRDNNCINGVDEGFTEKGEACTNQGCTGTKVCNQAGDGVACSALPPRKFYPDADGDQDGAPVAAVDVCEGQSIPQGHVENRHTDCDEADPTTFGGAPELCDAIDNNCTNGIADEPSTCGGTLKQVTDHFVTSNSRDWKTVSMKTVSTTVGGYPVWIAGTGGKLAVKRAANLRFESFSYGDSATPAPPAGNVFHPNNCGNNDWTVSWVDSLGRVFLGGREGRIALHNGAEDHTCFPDTTPPRVAGQPSLTITGIVGFEAGGQTQYLYLTDVGGRLIKWTLGPNPFSILHDPAVGTVRHYGLHSLREDFLLTVGGTVNSTQNRARSYNGATGGGTVTLHSVNSDAQANFAKAVWIGEENKACAVGDEGHVWRWSGGTTWTRVAAPAPDSTSDFTSVAMRYDRANPQSPGNEQCYMVDASTTGRLRRFTPFGWAREPVLPFAAEVALYGLSMNPTGSEFWIVGDDGRVFHYPEP